MLVAILSVIAATLALATSAAVADADGVCAVLDSGRVDVSGSHTSLVINAPAGELISGYCVKAGSVNQGYGPEYFTVNPASASVTISHSSGKDISHWSASYTTIVVEFTGEATVSGSVDICTAELTDVTVSYTSGPVTRTSTESQAAADAAAQAAAETAAAADLATQLAQYPDYTEGVCPVTPPPTVYTGEATVSGSLAICTAEGADVTVAYTSGPVTRTSTQSQAAADAAAQAAAETAAADDLAAELTGYPGYVEGTCPVTPPTPPTTPPTTTTTPVTPTEPTAVAPVLPATVEEPVEPVTVAPVLPATVEEPETVSVPMPAKVVLPATVPAGDGSSSTQVPSGALALAGVSLAGLGASTAMLVRRRAGDER